MNRNFFYILIALSILSCKDSSLPKTDLNNTEQIVITNKEFKFEKAEALNDEAVNYGKKGFSEKANKILLEALEIEPDNATILSNLGLVNSHLKNHDNSILYYQQALTISDSTYLSAGTNLSLEYFNIGEYQKGIEIADFVLKNTRNKYEEIGARIHKSFSLISKGECEKAKIELKIIKSYVNEIDNLEFQIKIIENKLKNCVQQRV
ncbi:hypothetical protein [uncultured Psychroserpens sp.]|uniref:tetratricopeptide repeat protein n=1 Tax=uncultured Psychroserpens sp. TaxID=255436 RepID=UPI002604882C|nr:hypothetical protein [uncultured Psychroserpens sp.]